MVSMMTHSVLDMLMMVVGIVRVTLIRRRAVMVHIDMLVMRVVMVVLITANH